MRSNASFGRLLSPRTRQCFARAVLLVKRRFESRSRTELRASGSSGSLVLLVVHHRCLRRRLQVLSAEVSRSGCPGVEVLPRVCRRMSLWPTSMQATILEARMWRQPLLVADVGVAVLVAGVVVR